MVFGSQLPVRGQLVLLGLAVAGIGSHSELPWLTWLGLGCVLLALAYGPMRSPGAGERLWRWARRLAVAAGVLAVAVLVSGMLINSGVPVLMVPGTLLFAAVLCAVVLTLGVVAIALANVAFRSLSKGVRKAAWQYGLVWALVREQYAPMAAVKERR